MTRRLVNVSLPPIEIDDQTGDLVSSNLRLGSLLVDVRTFGARINGVTDDTAAVNAAIQAAYDAGGGMIIFPVGVCLIAGQIVIPNDGTIVFNGSPRQPSIRLTGSASSGALIPGGGGAPVLFGSGPAYGGSILNLTYNSPTAKIPTFGVGMLEIDHLTLIDTGSDVAPFFFTSNTTVYLHDLTFLGTAVGSSNTNDAIWLGNSSTTPSGNFNAPFQGYGTIIKHCYFENVKRALYARAFTNSVIFAENTIWSSSGNPTGAAIELDGTGNANSGNYIADNLIEATHYQYGIKLTACTSNKLLRNDCWDPTPGMFISAILINTGTGSNKIESGIISPGTQPYVTYTNGFGLTETVINSREAMVFGTPLSVNLIATSALTAGQVVKMGASDNNIIVATTSDTDAGIAIGIALNSIGAGGTVQVGFAGKTSSPILGTGTASRGQFVIVDTTTNGRIKCTSSYVAGTVIGTVLSAQASVGSAVGMLLGLR